MIAYDTTRIVCLAFPILLISAEKIYRLMDSEKLTRWLLVLTLLNFLVLQYYISANSVAPMLPFFLND
jgi:hypothetical protein